MTYEYDFEMVKRAYAEMARRAREKDVPRGTIRGEPGRGEPENAKEKP